MTRASTNETTNKIKAIESSVAHLSVLEGVFVHVQHWYPGGVGWPSLGKEQGREKILRDADDGQDEDHLQLPFYKGQLHVPDPPEG